MEENAPSQGLVRRMETVNAGGWSPWLCVGAKVLRARSANGSSWTEGRCRWRCMACDILPRTETWQSKAAIQQEYLTLCLCVLGQGRWGWRGGRVEGGSLVPQPHSQTPAACWALVSAGPGSHHPPCSGLWVQGGGPSLPRG